MRILGGIPPSGGAGRVPPLLLLPLLAFAPGPSRGPSLRLGPRNSSCPEEGGRTGPGTPAGFHHVKLNGHTFTLPIGFTIEQAAGPDLAPRPIVAAFDDKGRLYVCDSSGSNAPVAQQVKTKPHRIVRLEDTNGDGRFDTSTVFVANVMFPEGPCGARVALRGCAAKHPEIHRHRWRRQSRQGGNLVRWEDAHRCANDLHGPYPGPDGWIYWCKGAFAKQEYTLPNGKPFTTRAAHIFRARPDGSKIEPVMTGGMDNPSMWCSHRRRADLQHHIFPTPRQRQARWAGARGLWWSIRQGPRPGLRPPVDLTTVHAVLTHLGPAAPCGLHRYESISSARLQK